jgi:hypothetical protein
MTSMTRRALGRNALAAALGLSTGLAGTFPLRTARAASLPQPAEKTILTVGGLISTTNTGDTARFDRPMLEAMARSEFVTQTPWYPDPVRFEGVPMDRLMREVGASGKSVIAYALNDYSTEIPISDFARYGVLFAIKRDGQYMPVRDKGPLFIVYPYDSAPELSHPQFYSRSAWQLSRLVIK